MAGFCEHCDEPLGSVKCGKFQVYLKPYCLGQQDYTVVLVMIMYIHIDFHTVFNIVH